MCVCVLVGCWYATMPLKSLKNYSKYAYKCIIYMYNFIYYIYMSYVCVCV